MMKQYNKLTPRERIFNQAVDRIKAGRASNPHETIEGITDEGAAAARAGHLTRAAEEYIWYMDVTDKQRERLIRQVERAVK
jgi:hypothetical protein